MKWIIYVLLLVNLGLFVWHYQPHADTRRHLAGDQLTRLVLLKEYEQQSHSVADSNDDSSCYSLGPFTRKDSFNTARERFTKQGIKVFSRVRSESVRDGYWVMLPAARSRSQAMVQIQKLKERGVKDYFLVAVGEMKNAISLGVFSKPKLAKQRSDEVEKLGFEPKIKQITLPKRVYWLEWLRHSGKQPDKSLLDGLHAQFEGIGQTERPCGAREKR